MSGASELLGARGGSDARIVGVVSAAHFVSHYYIMLLPPLFAFVRTDYGVSYTELGLALTAFNVVAATFQTPTGFLVDRLGPRILMIAGLALGAAAFAIAGLVDSFWVLVAMFALAGLGNTVYHPADYAMLSQHVPPERLGKAFSVHTFSGMLGSSVAPASLLLMQNLWGWRGAFLATALFGIGVAAILALQPERPARAIPNKPRAAAADAPVGWRLLLSPPILLNMALFAALALISGGLQNYSVVALGALYGTPVAAANAALTGYLLLAAIGVLIGGLLATRTVRHGLVAVLGLLAMTLTCTLVGSIDLGTFGFIAAMSVGGFFGGLIMPSRDMIVREDTPPGSFGKVFGFVSTGFSIGGIVSPLIFGAVMDRGSPHLVFLLVAAFSLLSIVAVAIGRKRSV
jgi:MFS family permease